VARNGFLAQDECYCDDPVGPSLRNQAQHLDLAIRQSGDIWRAAPRVPAARPLPTRAYAVERLHAELLAQLQPLVAHAHGAAQEPRAAAA